MIWKIMSFSCQDEHFKRILKEILWMFEGYQYRHLKCFWIVRGKSRRQRYLLWNSPHSSLLVQTFNGFLTQNLNLFEIKDHQNVLVLYGCCQTSIWSASFVFRDPQFDKFKKSNHKTAINPRKIWNAKHQCANNIP